MTPLQTAVGCPPDLSRHNPAANHTAQQTCRLLPGNRSCCASGATAPHNLFAAQRCLCRLASLPLTSTAACRCCWSTCTMHKSRNGRCSYDLSNWVRTHMSSLLCRRQPLPNQQAARTCDTESMQVRHNQLWPPGVAYCCRGCSCSHLPLLLSYVTDSVCSKHFRFFAHEGSGYTIRGEVKGAQPPAEPSCVASSWEPALPCGSRAAVQSSQAAKQHSSDSRMQRQIQQSSSQQCTGIFINVTADVSMFCLLCLAHFKLGKCC